MCSNTFENVPYSLENYPESIYKRLRHLHFINQCSLKHKKITLPCNYIQCWGKLLLKVMHYNIALLPKKVTNYIT